MMKFIHIGNDRFVNLDNVTDMQIDGDVAVVRMIGGGSMSCAYSFVAHLIEQPEETPEETPEPKATKKK